MKNKTYMVLLADRQKAKMFTFTDGVVGSTEGLRDGQVPQKVKHGDDTWDSQDKIFRHIEDHLHRHLLLIGQHANHFAQQNHISRIIIGSHKQLFSKIEKTLPYPLSRRVKGRFVTELKSPFHEITGRVKRLIDQIEQKKQEKKR